MADAQHLIRVSTQSRAMSPSCDCVDGACYSNRNKRNPAFTCIGDSAWLALPL